MYGSRAAESAKKKVKEVETTRKRKATDSAKHACRVGKVRQLDNETTKARKAYARHDGGVGPNDIMDDLSSDQLQHMTNLFYRSLATTQCHTSSAGQSGQSDCIASSAASSITSLQAHS